MIFQWLSFLFIRDKPKKEVPTFESIFQSPFKNFRPIFQTPLFDPQPTTTTRQATVPETTSTVVQNDNYGSIPIESKKPLFDQPQFYRGSQDAFPFFAGCKTSCTGVGECAPEICNGYCCKPTTQACPAAARELVEGTTFECISWFGDRSEMPAPEMSFVLGPKSKPAWAEEDFIPGNEEIIEESCACLLEDLPQEARKMKVECSTSETNECTCIFSCRHSPVEKTTTATCRRSSTIVSRYFSSQNDNFGEILDLPFNRSVESLAGVHRSLTEDMNEIDFIWSYPKLGFMCDEIDCELRISAKLPTFRSKSEFVDAETPRQAASKNPVLEEEDGWYVSFSDEFNKKELNKLKWNTIDHHRGFFDGKSVGRYSWWWRSRNLNLRAGKLALAFEHDWTMDDKIGTPVLSSAHINSDCKFEQQYGFFEARIKVVYPEGRQSAFWLNSNYGTIGKVESYEDFVPTGNASKGAEIDIVEANFKSDAYTTNIHWDGYKEHHKTSFGKVWTWNSEGKRTLLTDPIKYHNFGLKWTPKYLEFYYDGKLKRRVTDQRAIPHTPLYPILSGGLFDSTWSEGNITAVEFPDYMLVDWIRIYQKADFEDSKDYNES